MPWFHNRRELYDGRRDRSWNREVRKDGGRGGGRNGEGKECKERIKDAGERRGRGMGVRRERRVEDSEDREEEVGKME